MKLLVRRRGDKEHVVDAVEGSAITQFGQRLRHWRLHANLTQLQLGVRLNYHHSVISKLEGGSREPTLALARRLDEILKTGGELSAACASRPSASGLATAGGFAMPLPDGDARHDVSVRNSGWPVSLPAGLVCPLHGGVDCRLSTPEDALAAYSSISAAAPAGVDVDTLHGLTALLAAFAKATQEETAMIAAGPVEMVLKAIVRWIGAVPGTVPTALLRLAGNYAQIAGRLRMQRGQNGLAVGWFGNGMHWAAQSGDVEIQATLLSDMSLICLLEHDPLSALGYARALRALDPARAWIATLSDVYQARGHALNGDPAQCHQHVDSARRNLALVDERDETEAPWLAGDAGCLRVESGIGGALRDVAALTASKAAAQLATTATKHSLLHVPPRMRPTRLLLTLRLADNYACAGDPASAVAIASPILPEAVSAPRVTINRELQGLRIRLMARWSNVPQVRDFAERLRAHA